MSKNQNKSLLAKIGDFFFGRTPDIFDEKGQVFHDHPKKKWDDWHGRIKYNPSYNWRQHTGTRTGATTNNKNS